MRRLSIPVDEELYNKYNKRFTQHGIKAAVVRGLVRIILDVPEKLAWSVAMNENKPEKFSLKELEDEASR